MDITKYFSKAGGSASPSPAKVKKEEPAKATPKRIRPQSKVVVLDDSDNDSSQEITPSVKNRKKRAVIESDEDDVILVESTKSEPSKDKNAKKKAKVETKKAVEEVDPTDYFASSKKPSTSAKKGATKKEDVEVLEEVETKPDNNSKPTKPHASTPAASKTKDLKSTKAKPETKKKAKAKIEESDDDFDGGFDAVSDEEVEEVKPKEEPKPKEKKAAVKAETKKEKAAKAAGAENETPTKKPSLWQLKNRLPPQSLGTREIPQAAPNCFAGFTFVVSGEFETITRNETEDLIKRYGGRITSAISGKTTHFVKGREAGPSKTEKAEKLGTKIVDEDGFFELLKTSQSKEIEMPPIEKPTASAAKGKKKEEISANPEQSSMLWTEKYKPQKMEEILGNKELVKRISAWLKDWDSSYSSGFKFRNKESINDFSAVLLSGPPGIGKTTAAHVIAKTNGYELLEFNASDVRSKKILEESVSEMMDNRTMTEFFAAGKPKGDRLINGKKVVLVMDEVDGMSAGDRGGAAEMAKLIKKSKIPVICICNDNKAKKIEPLLRVCYEAKFKRTPAAQLRSRFMTIAFREKLKIEPNALDQLVEATRNDIRQIINILSTYRLGQQTMNFDQAKAVGKMNEKYSQINLFEIPGMLLSAARSREMTLAQKSEIYFHDYSLSHLMFFENYVRWMPEQAKAASNQNEMDCKYIEAIADAAEAMSEGAMVDGMIHGSTQHWSLMPVHSMFSMVRPAHFMKGQFAGAHRLNFPAWLGQNSKTQKKKRLLRELQIHMRTKSSGDKYEVRQNYLPVLNQLIFSALLEEDYDAAFEIMDSYYLDKDLVDAIAELEFPLRGQKTLQSQLTTSIKSTFTRKYNSTSHPVMLQPGGQTIKKAIAVPMDDPEGTIFDDEADFGGDVSEEEQAADNDDATNLAKDKFIKTKDLSAKGKTASKAGVKRKATTSASSSAKKKK
ncbi:replication factor RFC1 C terminal domain-containing protein [Umbelopsis sp. AD052]|nr:replication factor RFC1 C terminal domain-containing protein [Umbelopsis sp. AD052]